MTMTAPPTADRLLEGWREATFSAAATVNPRIRRHGRILIRIGGDAIQRPPIAIMPECG